MKLALGNISPGIVDVAFMQSVVNAVCANVVDTVICATGPYLDDNRNEVCLTFLRDTECDALLFVDSDVVFTPDDVTALTKDLEGINPQDVVAGWYMGTKKGAKGVCPIVYDWWLDVDHNVLENVDETTITASSELLEVSSVGAGFLLIQRPLLETFHALTPKGCPFFTEPVIDGVHYGEDHGFCFRVTDERIGGRVFVDPRVRLQHYKKVVL